MNKSTIKAFAALTLLGLAMSVLVLLMLQYALQAEPPAEDLAGRGAPEVVRRTLVAVATDAYVVTGVVVRADGTPVAKISVDARSGADKVQVGTELDGSFRFELDEAATIRVMAVDPSPTRVEVDQDATLRFVLPDLCPLEVLVLDDQGGPIPEADVTLWTQTSPDTSYQTGRSKTDPGGRAVFPGGTCGLARVDVEREGFAMAVRDDVDTMVQTDLTVHLTAGVRLSGMVMDPRGEAIPGALVRAGDAGADTTDETGAYSIRIEPSEIRTVGAHADGYTHATERVRPSEDDSSGEIVIDLVLDPTHEVTVYCAGMPDDSCDSVDPLMCTRPLVPVGEPCLWDPAVCACPEGEAAVRGGGTTVTVEPGQEIVWLDLRHGGGLTGRVLVDGEPVDCTGSVVNQSSALKDLTQGISNRRSFACDEHGQFLASGLSEGAWHVEIESGEQTRTMKPARVDGALVDLGDIEMDGGGTISGVVIDGVTDEGAPGVVVAAVRTDGDQTTPATATATSGSEGVFEMHGLPDGTYDVIVATRPFARQSLTLVDGEAPEVELETAAATMLEENGFGLRSDDEGQLVVDSVDADGAAAVSGLTEGDVVVSVEIMGTDVADVVPDLASDVTEFILEHWSGTGVDLVVEREGERRTVPMD